MKILQVSYYDNFGGAARVAWLLHQGYKLLGNETWVASSFKFSEDPFVFRIPVFPPRSSIGRQFFSFANLSDKHNWMICRHPVSGIFKRLAEPKRYLQRFIGKEDFDFPGSRTLLGLLPGIPDIVHLHNLHLNYFDLSYLPELSNRFPTIITLHDMWTLTGHCAYSLDCERWKTGCGDCPHLSSYPAMHRDNTAYNWQRKKGIYSRSRLYIVSPSNWLIHNAEQSILSQAIIRTKVIHNGIDLGIFYPKDKLLARKALELPEDAVILLFISAGGMNRNSYKDFNTIQSSIEIVSRRIKKQKLIFIALGGIKAVQCMGNIEIRYVPYQTSLEKVANYYRASDIYLHAAKAETFGNVLLEAQACGTPVISTNTGGTAETLIDGKTGFLTQTGNSIDMAEKIIQLLDDKSLRESMGISAADNAQKYFGQDQMVDEYLKLYQEILDESSK